MEANRLIQSVNIALSPRSRSLPVESLEEQILDSDEPNIEENGDFDYPETYEPIYTVPDLENELQLREMRGGLELGQYWTPETENTESFAPSRAIIPPVYEELPAELITSSPQSTPIAARVSGEIRVPSSPPVLPPLPTLKPLGFEI